MYNTTLWFLLLLVVTLLPDTRTSAADGQSPQSVLVVVNSQSLESLAVANRYISLRKIPPCNVVYLDGVTSAEGDDESISSANYRREILEPISKRMDERGIRQQINCIAYSAGFPTRVLIRPEVDKYLKFRKKEFSRYHHSPYASLNSATLFQDGLFAEKPTFLDDHSNLYGQNSFGTSHVFSSQVGWSEAGEPLRDGEKYVLSTVLAVVRPNGSTVEQALSQLDKSASADGKKPHGVFYFANHSDVRSRTRDNQYESAAQMLRSMGFKVEVGSGKLPQNKRVLGATLGSAKLDWSTSKSEFAAGALCDNFTSFGAYWKKSQTKLTHFLNHGAAGGTGTVCEPYTIATKIPSTAIHIHYARGCTLAESIYQTVRAPFQLLVVGDPLCRPFASLPRFTVEGIEDRVAVRKDLEIKLKAKLARYSIKDYSVFLDGIHWKKLGRNEDLKLPLSELSGGYHELQITAFDSSVARASSTQTFGFFVIHSDPRPQPRLKLDIDNVVVDQSDSLSVACEFPAGMKVRLVQNARVIGEFVKAGEPISIDARLLGSGKTKLHASTVINDQLVRGVPLEVTVRR